MLKKWRQLHPQWIVIRIILIRPSFVKIITTPFLGFGPVSLIMSVGQEYKIFIIMRISRTFEAEAIFLDYIKRSVHLVFIVVSRPLFIFWQQIKNFWHHIRSNYPIKTWPLHQMCTENRFISHELDQLEIWIIPCFDYLAIRIIIRRLHLQTTHFLTRSAVTEILYNLVQELLIHFSLNLIRSVFYLRRLRFSRKNIIF